MSRDRLAVLPMNAANDSFDQAESPALPAGDLPSPDAEAEWEWNTRVTAEAARAALLQGKTPQERFAIYEQLITAALEKRKCTEPEKSAATAAATAACITFNTPFIDVDTEGPAISGFGAMASDDL